MATRDCCELALTRPQEDLGRISEALVRILRDCTRTKDLLLGRLAHHAALFLLFPDPCGNPNGVVSDQHSSRLGCELIRMFGACGSMRDARHVFARSPCKNAYAWTAMISVLAHHGFCLEALELYEEMQASGTGIAPHAAVLAIKACASIADLRRGQLVHSGVVKQEMWPDNFIASALVDMYCKCGSVEDALCVFDRLPRKDVVMWSAMAAGYAHHGYDSEALQLYDRMQVDGVEPNEVTFVSVLKSCGALKALEQGRVIHSEVIKRSKETNLIIGNVLVDMYSKCGTLEDASNTFDRLPAKDVISWNAIIAAFFSHREFSKAMRSFNEMQMEGVEPSKPIILCLLQSFTAAGDLDQVRLVHAYILFEQAILDKFIDNTLVDGYSKCGTVMDALKVFNGLQKPDVVSWNAMIAGYAECGLGDEAFDLFRRMKLECRNPDKVTFLSVLKACISALSSTEGKLIHTEIMKQNHESDLYVGSTLVVMYAKCGSAEDACNWFDRLPTRNAVSWNALITCYSDCGHFAETVNLFRKMRNEGIEPNMLTSLAMLRASAVLAAHDLGNLIHSDAVEQAFEQDTGVQNAVLDMYIKCGSFPDAERVLDMMLVQDVVSWSSLVSGYVEQGNGVKALQVLATMQCHGIEPNKITYLCAFKACSSISALQQGRLLHAAMLRQDLELESSVGSSLVDMYAKCSSLDDAQSTFDKLPQRCVVCWSALIGGYADNGFGEEALELYDEMILDGVPPNDVTCLSVMKACSNIACLHSAKCLHDGIVERGLDLSSSVQSTLVDMYVKCGSLEDALAAFDSFVIKDVVSWNSIIGGYADHGSIKLAHLYFTNMQLEGIKPDRVTFVCLLYACSHAGLVCEGYGYFKSMVDECGLSPRIRHFVCMIDLLGRSGQLDKAEELVSSLPCESNSAVFLSLLGSCAKYREAEIASKAFDSLRKFDCRSSSTYVLMSNIYSSNKVWEDTFQIDDTLGMESG